MGFLVKKQKGLIITGIVGLAIVSFIASLSFALIDTIWAVYLNSFVNSAAIVGLISSFLTIAAFISYFLIVPFIEKVNKVKIYSISLFIFAIAYILFAINTKFYIFIIVAFITTIIHTIRITSFGIIIKDNSPANQLSRNEGLMYTFANTAWLIGPLISGFISDKYGISIIFVLSTVFILTALILFKMLNIKDNNIKKRADYSFIKNFKDFFKSKDRVFAYVISGGVNYWWSFIYLFIPIFIIEKGLQVSWVGYFLFAIVIPIMFTQYYFSKLAGKIGFRTIFKIGYFIPAVFALLCFFTANIYLILLYLILASFGLAMLEPTTEAYFFDVLKGREDLRFYGPYNTTIDANNLIGRVLSTIILFLLPFNYLFLFYSFSMFIFFLISFKTRKIIEGNRKR